MIRASQTPRVFGHRGACGYRPEHTRESYKLALRMGADAVEPDVVASRDGVLVLRHDNEISATTDVSDHSEFAERRTTKEINGVPVTGWFTEDFTWAELSTLRAREWLPTLRPVSVSFDNRLPLLRLSDLLELLNETGSTAEPEGPDDQGTGWDPQDTSPGGLVPNLLRPGLVLEIKHASYFASLGLPLDELVADELRRAGWDNDDGLVVESFEKTALAGLSARGIGGQRVYLAEATGAAPDLVAREGSAAPSYAEEVSNTGLAALAAREGTEHLDGVSVDKALLLNAGTGKGRQAFVDRAHELDLTVYAWTLRPENFFLNPAWRTGFNPMAWGNWEGELLSLFATGLDAVFVDHPDIAIAARDSAKTH